MKEKFKRFRLSQWALLLSPVLLSVACGKMSARNDAFADATGSKVGCLAFQESFFDELYKFPQDDQAFPSEREMHEAFDRSISQGRLANLSAADRVRVSDALTELYKLLAIDSVRELGVENGTSDEKLATLTALEIGDRTSEKKEVLQTRIAEEFAKINAIVDQQALPACANPKPDLASTPVPSATPSGTAPTTLFTSWKATRHPAVYGALKTFATSYQSCSATGVTALSTATEDVRGITVVGTHSDGIGSRRQVTDIQALLKSHPYLKNYQKPKSSCFNVAATPLIYDYGGRPITSAGTFDMFKNSGSGTSVLGTDCSGYAYMALATAGLRIKKSSTLKAVTIHGVTSRMFLDPQKNGMTCLDYASFSGANTLRAGDIIAKAGHVVIVGSIGTDPFGIDEIKSVADCVPAKMSTERFNFTILQSSPSKNGIGIHAHKASSYLPESPALTDGLLIHAANACKAKFGQTLTSKTPAVSIVRHSGAANCKDKEVLMERESCVSSCPATRTAAAESVHEEASAY